MDYERDIEAARRIYVDVPELEVERENPTFIQVDGFATASDEQMGRGLAPAPRAQEAPGRGSAGRATWAGRRTIPHGHN